jgi:hypothetical protein
MQCCDVGIERQSNCIKNVEVCLIFSFVGVVLLVFILVVDCIYILCDIKLGYRPTDAH